MKKQKNYVFLDCIFIEYNQHYGEEWEQKLVEELKNYLSKFTKNSEIIVITSQDSKKINEWLFKHGLDKFVDNVLN